MKSCIRVPRILLPRGDFSKWSVISCDRFSSDPAYWRRAALAAGDAPSALRLILPEVFRGEDDDARIAEIRESMYEALEGEWVEKLTRGFVRTERTTVAGKRTGIVVAVDLEAYSSDRGGSSPIRASEEPDPTRVAARLALRRGALLEFPHVMLFYRDKKRRVSKLLAHEELEELYDFELMEDGGRLKGSFIPADLAEEVAEATYSRGEPSFVVAEGNDDVAAAKAYWEELKPDLTAREFRNHPARFLLAELVDLCDEAVTLEPVHRLVKGVETEVFCDFFQRAVRCRREGNVLYPAFQDPAEGVARTDALVAEFLKRNGGTVGYVCGTGELGRLAKEEDCAGVVLGAIGKDDLFPALKGGKLLPAKTFCVGGARGARYYVEGREIGYD